MNLAECKEPIVRSVEFADVALIIIGATAATLRFVFRLRASVLAGIVLIRTFLSFPLEIEIEGRWPWTRAGSQFQAGGV